MVLKDPPDPLELATFRFNALRKVKLSFKHNNVNCVAEPRPYLNNKKYKKKIFYSLERGNTFKIYINIKNFRQNYVFMFMNVPHDV